MLYLQKKFQAICTFCVKFIHVSILAPIHNKKYILPVVVEEGIGQILERIGISGAEEAVLDLVDALPEFRVAVVVVEGVIAALVQRVHLLDVHTKDEDVVVAHLLGHFDVGAIEGADGERTVQHELHVAGAGGLGAGGRDLLAQVGGRDDLLGKGHAVVLQVDHLELVADDGVVVDHVADGADQSDDVLGHVVAGGSLKLNIRFC